jgi:hypothetical protein
MLWCYACDLSASRSFFKIEVCFRFDCVFNLVKVGEKIKKSMALRD